MTSAHANAASPYRLLYLDQAPPLDDHMLARIRHGTGLQPEADPRDVTVDLAVVDGPGCECWISPTVVRTGELNGVRYAKNGEVLFGSVYVPEERLRHVDRAVLHAYARIEHVLQMAGYPCWLRMWNYLAHISKGKGDAERYRQFSLGRYKALSLKPGFENELPAATAIGSRGGGLLVYFLAGRTPGAQIENPRQVSAFRYPREYGPRSPSFSRATLKTWGTQATLLVSGTASVVGHASAHVGDPAAQLRETLANLDALLGEASAKKLPDPVQGALRPGSFKIYVRDRSDWPTLRPIVQAAFGAKTPVLTLEADVCRRDLLLEIEGVYFMGSGNP